jgi:3,4-dihydroxy 2-butanone 4-phosphate synthase/GTP cyclohydrolase II
VRVAYKSSSPRELHDTVKAVLDALRVGRPVVVLDDLAGEPEGDVVVAAEFATPELVAFMAREARGLIRLALTPERCDQLRLRSMAADGGGRTDFTISVEARHGVTTGISAEDRARTIAVAIDSASGPEDLVCPGHMFPLRTRSGGVLQRAVPADAGVDLARLAGLTPAAVLCEVLDSIGAVADPEVLAQFCARHRIPAVTLSGLIAYRRRTERLIERESDVRLHTQYGVFRAVTYCDVVTELRHVALVRGQWAGEDVLTSVHAECVPGDVFHSLHCDCGEQLDAALRRIDDEGAGLLLYVAQEGRGITLANTLEDCALRDGGLETVDADSALGFPADARNDDIGAQILADLGVRSVRLLTNNPTKSAALEVYGVAVHEQLPIEVSPRSEGREHPVTKKLKLGHRLVLAPDARNVATSSSAQA